MQQFDPSQLAQLLRSPAGQQLIQLLQKNSSDTMKTAVSQASQGDYAQAKKTLSPLMNTPEIQALLRQLGGDP